MQWNYVHRADTKVSTITFYCLLFIKSFIFRNERCILKFQSVDSVKNQIHLIIMLTGEMLFAGKFNKL